MEFEEAVVRIIDVRNPDDLIIKSGFVHKIEGPNQGELVLHLDSGYKIAITEKPKQD